ncbi:MAG TPA: 50S ribosomal protein L18, partial [Spirochaetota bacterium]|nr:50S ribosomal protein L18 [Spirochaetota bacterium]
MFKKNWVIERRLRRKKSIKTKIFGTVEKPRLSVFRSNRYIYVQAIDDDSGTTLASASSI